jgi:exopolysaccharide biosynthesis polyprenyl glycosylphosphotransferase
MQLPSFLWKSKATKYNGNHRPTINQASLTDDQSGLYHQVYFHALLENERKRCERSDGSVLLLLFDLTAFEDVSEIDRVARSITERLAHLTRQTDVKGWYTDHAVVGVLFTELAGKLKNAKKTPLQIVNKCCSNLNSWLGVERYSKIEITWQVFPETFPLFTDGDESDVIGGSHEPRGKDRRGLSLLTKRFIDIAGSLTAIIWLAPVFVAISVLIKITSEGPVLFKQERVGFKGKRFMLLKFRSMQVDNDPTIHKEYVKNLINGGKNGTSQHGQDAASVTYKIKDDPRVTPIGRILRKTSLDELPQFINVLKGDMSLVGPRPPIAYECEDYDVWHRNRVLNMKPGITGLWQVYGRSRTTFDEMVRMDIRYIREWSLWLDLKIIFKTPLVVFMGHGAY